MIVKEQPTSLQLFIALQGSIVPKIISKVAMITALSLAVLLVDQLVTPLPRISITAMGVFGIVMSLFLGFRNNAAYERWWEGRKLWGSMIADSRTLARHTRLFIADEQQRKTTLTSAMASFHLLRGHLRRIDATNDAANWVGYDTAKTFSQTANAHDAALGAITNHIAQLARNDQISGVGQLAFSQTMASITSAQSGCERISNTPLPYVYSLLVRRTTYIYCWLLPFALLDSTGGFAPLVAAFVAYVFFGLQALTHELEMPFQNLENGVPLDALCRSIEITLAGALGRDIPALLEPQNSIIT